MVEQVNIFERMDNVRRFRKMTVEDFVEAMGYKTRCVYYGTWQKDPDSLKIKHIKKAAEILDCSSDYLLGLSNSMTA